MTATLLLTTVTVLLAQTPNAKAEPAKPKPSLLDDAPKIVNNLDETDRDKIVDRFIQFDIGKLRGTAGAEAHAAFQKLDARALPALARGLSRASQMEASCPALVIAARMRSLLSTTDDPKVLEYCQKTIALGGYHRQAVAGVRAEVTERLAAIQKGQTAAQKARDNLVRNLAAKAEPDLKEALKDENPEVRWAAVRVINGKQLRYAEELIAVLDDANEDVRIAAHQALVTLSRGCDYGPDAETSPEEAIPRWRNWLTADRDRLELLRAPVDRQEELLKKLAAAKGMVYTDALALAIPDLSAPLQEKARDALVERLARMTAATLRDKLDDPGREVRRAAALACAMKEERENVPALIQRLDDAEVMVVRAAQSALKEMTKQDFGPGNPAVKYERLEAVKQWKVWWEKQKK
jgi:HEAT repeat protein